VNQSSNGSTESKKKANQDNEAIRYLAFILRHRPHEAKIKLDDGGWAEVEVLSSALSRFKKIKLTADELIALVKSKSKNSFLVSEDGKMIKAKSGHTVLLGYSETLKVPNSLRFYMPKSQITAVFTSGLTMKPGEFLAEKLDGPTPDKMVLVTINTSKAKGEKTKFYCKGDAFFAFHIPSNCLTFSSF
jgi:hypothetical protein